MFSCIRKQKLMFVYVWCYKLCYFVTNFCGVLFGLFAFMLVLLCLCYALLRVVVAGEAVVECDVFFELSVFVEERFGSFAAVLGVGCFSGVFDLHDGFGCLPDVAGRYDDAGVGGYEFGACGGVVDDAGGAAGHALGCGHAECFLIGQVDYDVGFRIGCCEFVYRVGFFYAYDALWQLSYLFGGESYELYVDVVGELFP